MIRKKDDPGKDDPEFLFYQGLRGIIPFDTFFLFFARSFCPAVFTSYAGREKIRYRML